MGKKLQFGIHQLRICDNNILKIILEQSEMYLLKFVAYDPKQKNQV